MISQLSRQTSDDYVDKLFATIFIVYKSKYLFFLSFHSIRLLVIKFCRVLLSVLPKHCVKKKKNRALNQKSITFCCGIKILDYGYGRYIIYRFSVNLEQEHKTLLTVKCFIIYSSKTYRLSWTDSSFSFGCISTTSKVLIFWYLAKVKRERNAFKDCRLKFCLIRYSAYNKKRTKWKAISNFFIYLLILTYFLFFLRKKNLVS